MKDKAITAAMLLFWSIIAIVAFYALAEIGIIP